MSARRAFYWSCLRAFVLTLTLLGALAGGAVAVMIGNKPVRFANTFLTFKLPRGWSCALDETEQVCRLASDSNKSREAIIILAMKERGDSDSLDIYLDHLRKPQRPGGSPATSELSEVRHVGTRRIGTHTWIESVHLGSELPNFVTHYYAGLMSRVAVLVTFSAHKDYYADYVADIDAMIDSLVIYQSAMQHRTAAK